MFRNVIARRTLQRKKSLAKFDANFTKHSVYAEFHSARDIVFLVGARHSRSIIFLVERNFPQWLATEKGTRREEEEIPEMSSMTTKTTTTTTTTSSSRRRKIKTRSGIVINGVRVLWLVLPHGYPSI